MKSSEFEQVLLPPLGLPEYHPFPGKLMDWLLKENTWVTLKLSKCAP